MTKRRLALAVLPMAALASADFHETPTETIRVHSETARVEMEDLQAGKTCTNDGGEGCSQETEDSIPTNLDECGIWLAPSSIPGAGLGMYAGRSFEEGELLQQSGDVVINQIDINQHNYHLGDKYFNLFDEYTWSGVSLLRY